VTGRLDNGRFATRSATCEATTASAAFQPIVTSFVA
jgi:hypothetical protein